MDGTGQRTMNGKTASSAYWQQGFAYLTLLFIIIVMGIFAGAVGSLWSASAIREKEEELLFRGSEIRSAIGRYYEGGLGAKSYPRSLEDLLKDARYPVAKRYLRKIYLDPVTGMPDWEFVKAPDSGIMGVKSRSGKEPYKKKNFPKELVGFESKSKYSEWEFIYVPQTMRKTQG